MIDIGQTTQIWSGNETILVGGVNSDSFNVLPLLLGPFAKNVEPSPSRQLLSHSLKAKKKPVSGPVAGCRYCMVVDYVNLYICIYIYMLYAFL